MGSSLENTPADSDESSKKPASKILLDEIEEGLRVLNRESPTLFVSALSGGLDLGFSLFFMALMWTLTEGVLPELWSHLLVANMYALGFIFVIIGRSELFTEQTSLAVLPVLRGTAKVPQLLRIWTIVLAGNLIGGAAFASLIVYLGPAMNVIEPRAFVDIAHELLKHSNGIMFLSAVLAGWLMGLLSWMVAAGRDTISQIVLVWLVATAIGLGGFAHVVLGSIEVLAGVLVSDEFGVADYFRFLLWATLGNVVGGSVFVAIIKYGHARSASHTG